MKIDGAPNSKKKHNFFFCFLFGTFLLKMDILWNSEMSIYHKKKICNMFKTYVILISIECWLQEKSHILETVRALNLATSKIIGSSW